MISPGHKPWESQHGKRLLPASGWEVGDNEGAPFSVAIDFQDVGEGANLTHFTWRGMDLSVGNRPCRKVHVSTHDNTYISLWLNKYKVLFFSLHYLYKRFNI